MPTNVTASGGFSTILVEWDAPSYSGHSYTEVLRSSTDNISESVTIATPAANLYSDQVGGDKGYYYWVRFVNKLNITGPIQSTQGVFAETQADVQDVIDQLIGEIDETFFTPEFNETLNNALQGIINNEGRINDIDGEIILAKENAEHNR